MFDAEHETRRKQQLERLYSRTPKQVFIFFFQIGTQFYTCYI